MVNSIESLPAGSSAREAGSRCEGSMVLRLGKGFLCQCELSIVAHWPLKYSDLALMPSKSCGLIHSLLRSLHSQINHLCI